MIFKLRARPSTPDKISNRTEFVTEKVADFQIYFKTNFQPKSMQTTNNNKINRPKFASFTKK